MASECANEASEAPGSSRVASWGHPCDQRGPRASPSPVPNLGTGPSGPWEPCTRNGCESAALLALRASSKESARRASFFTAQISRSWNVLSTFFVINAMQGPQRPRRASTQALAAMTTPEQRNSFEAAQVFKATTRFVVVDS